MGSITEVLDLISLLLNYFIGFNPSNPENPDKPHIHVVIRVSAKINRRFF